MDLLICGKSALNFYRTPPQLLALYPALPLPVEDSNHMKRAASPIVTDLLKAPLHRAVSQRQRRSGAGLYRSHFFRHELPPGSILDTDHGFQVTSPAMTLLSLATDLPRTQLLMALYEMSGSFAVCNLCGRSEYLLQQALDQRCILPNEGWRRVIDVNGNGTGLWKRSPLLTTSELETFCDHARGFRGIKNLVWAMEHITGEAASPFEVQASILLAAPRAAGGEGLSIKNNQRIQLSGAARAVYDRASCYADILIEGQGENAGVIIECQGRSVHASDRASILDSNRTTALTRMGYEVILLTYEQIANARAFDAVLEIIARKTDVGRRPKTVRQLAAEEKLRRELFTDWDMLGN